MARKPEDIAQTSEHSHQAAYFAWANQFAYKRDPRLKFIFAVPNGGLRNVKVATKMKAEGAKAGVPDVVVPIVVRNPLSVILKPGLYLEFKKPGNEGLKNGGLEDKQVEYRDFLISEGYRHEIVYSWLQAKDVTLEYLGYQ